jgi:hypothetical protein
VECPRPQSAAGRARGTGSAHWSLFKATTTKKTGLWSREWQRQAHSNTHGHASHFIHLAYRVAGEGARRTHEYTNRRTSTTAIAQRTAYHVPNGIVSRGASVSREDSKDEHMHLSDAVLESFFCLVLPHRGDLWICETACTNN